MNLPRLSEAVGDESLSEDLREALSFAVLCLGRFSARPATSADNLTEATGALERAFSLAARDLLEGHPYFVAVQDHLLEIYRTGETRGRQDSLAMIARLSREARRVSTRLQNRWAALQRARQTNGGKYHPLLQALLKEALAASTNEEDPSELSKYQSVVTEIAMAIGWSTDQYRDAVPIVAVDSHPPHPDELTLVGQLYERWPASLITSALNNPSNSLRKPRLYLQSLVTAGHQVTDGRLRTVLQTLAKTAADVIIIRKGIPAKVIILPEWVEDR